MTQTIGEALRTCGVSAPGGPAPPGDLPPPPYVGNGHLWVGVWPHGLVIVPPGNIGRDGSMRAKFMWFRGRGAHGLLDIGGSEANSGAAVRGRTHGYGLRGFNASSIFFPGPGCYHVTGMAGAAQLTFTTLVRSCSVRRQLPRAWRKDLAIWCRA